MWHLSGAKVGVIFISLLAWGSGVFMTDLDKAPCPIQLFFPAYPMHVLITVRFPMPTMSYPFRHPPPPAELAVQTGGIEDASFRE
jgi:hypothetical protein